MTEGEWSNAMEVNRNVEPRALQRCRNLGISFPVYVAQWYIVFYLGHP